MGDTRIISDIVKEYPDMLKIIIYHRDYQLNTASSSDRKATKQRTARQKKEESIHRSVRRTKSVISDIVLSNRFDFWCTFTFSSKKYDRMDVARCRQVMSLWLHNQSKHSPSLEYLVVPEFHKDGAIHFHAMLKNFNGRLKDTGLKTKAGQTIFNMSGYQGGFSTAVPIDTNYSAVSAYMQKYITKDMPLIHGRKRYWCSRGLVRPTTTVNGVFKLGLSGTIRQKKPEFVNEFFEVQYHRKSRAALTIDQQIRVV